jgi:hypothetical protein
MQNTVTVDGEQFSIHRVFYLAELAAILHMPQSLVQNWTMGRPLKITPHRTATGSGSRNLYDMHDVYRFGIAKHLSMDGLAPHAIQSILDALGVDFSSAAFAIVTSGSSRSAPWKRKITPRLHLVSQAQYERDGWGMLESAVSKSVGCYVLNILGITESVNHLVATFLQGRSEKLPLKHVAQRSPRRANPPKGVPEIFGPRKRKFRHEGE